MLEFIKSEVENFKKNDFIKPRTPNQLEYLKKVRDNDIVFAIGPAGTPPWMVARAITAWDKAATGPANALTSRRSS